MNGQNPVNPDTAILSNGNFVTVFSRLDDFGGGTESVIGARISLADGSNSTVIPVIAAADGLGDFDPHVAALTGGGFVVVWNEASDIFAKIYDDSGSALGGVVTLTSGGDIHGEPDVIGLDDGGFLRRLGQ